MPIRLSPKTRFSLMVTTSNVLGIAVWRENFHERGALPCGVSARWSVARATRPMPPSWELTG